MRRLAIYLMTLLVAASCVQQPTNKPVTIEPPQPGSRVEKFVLDFKARHPDGFNNSIQLDRMNAAFMNEVVDSLLTKKDFVLGLPIRFQDVKRIPGNNKKCYVHFQSWIRPYGFEFSDNDLRGINFDLVGEVPIEYADSLVKEEFYCISGKCLKFLNENQLRKYATRIPYTYEIGLSEDSISSSLDWYEAKLSVMLFDIDRITPYKRKY